MQQEQQQIQKKKSENDKKNGNNKQQNAEYELYKRIKLLGEGSFGKAYLVEYLEDKSKWVIKQMCMNTMSPEERTSTFKEAKILKALKHPNIVQFKEVYKTKKGKLCIVMEYADGGDLAKTIKQAKGKLFPESLILDWFTQICLALKHVHDKKIIHRDLKGQNVFLTKDNRIKLGDFGIARILTKTIEKCKTVVGTPYYLSPEIIENRPYSFKSDIWSLGVLLYELCTHKPPFNADSMTFLALAIVRGKYNPIPDTYSQGLQKLVKSLLHVKPEKRPTVHDILQSSVIQNRIKEFLSETVHQKEFDHTILHNQQIINSQDDYQFNNIKVVNKELPMPPQLLKEHIKKEKKARLPQIQSQQQPIPQRDIKTAQQPRYQENTPQNNMFKKKPQNVLLEKRNNREKAIEDKNEILKKQQQTPQQQKFQEFKQKPQTPGPNLIRKKQVINKPQEERLLTPSENAYKLGFNMQGGQRFSNQNNQQQVLIQNNNQDNINVQIRRQFSQPDIKLQNGLKNNINGNQPQLYQKTPSTTTNDNDSGSQQSLDEFTGQPKSNKKKFDYLRKKQPLMTPSGQKRKPNQYLVIKQKDEKQLLDNLKRQERKKRQEDERKKMLQDIDLKRSTIRRDQKNEIFIEINTPSQKNKIQNIVQFNKVLENNSGLYKKQPSNQQDLESKQNSNNNFYSNKPQPLKQHHKNNRVNIGTEETPSEGGKKKVEDIFGLARPKTGKKKLEQQQQQQQMQQQKKLEQQKKQQQQQQLMRKNSSQDQDKQQQQKFQKHRQHFQQNVNDADKNIENLKQAQKQAKIQLNQTPDEFEQQMFSELQNIIQAANQVVDKAIDKNVQQQFGYNENKNYFDKEETIINQPPQLQFIKQISNADQETVKNDQFDPNQEDDDDEDRDDVDSSDDEEEYLQQQQQQLQKQLQQKKNQQQQYQQQQKPQKIYDKSIVPHSGFKLCEDTMTEMTKEQEQSMLYMDQDYQKLKSLRNLLEDVFGKFQFERAYKIMQSEVQQHSDIAEIEKIHGKDNYSILLPFLDQDLIKKYISLLVTLVIMEGVTR